MYKAHGFSLTETERENRMAKVLRAGICCVGEARCLLTCQEALSQCMKAEHHQQCVPSGTFFSLGQLCPGPASLFNG